MKAQGRNKPRTKRYVVVLTEKQEKARRNMPDGIRQGFDAGVTLRLRKTVKHFIQHIPEIVEHVKNNVENNVKRALSQSNESTNQE